MEPAAGAERGDIAVCCARTRVGEQAADNIMAASHTEVDVNFNDRVNFDAKRWFIFYPLTIIRPLIVC
jgi:hypothetical protein